MEITKSLVPNCSEFVFYVNLKDSDKKAIKRFKEMIKKLEEYETLEEFGLHEIPYIERTKIFGIECYVIKGETGDHGTTLGNKIEETGVKFEKEKN